jgi:calcineurin-like phosphoesterase family protein
MSKLFFSSDWHLGHQSILDYTERGTLMIPARGDLSRDERLAEHNAWLIERIDETVPETATHYVLGDIAFGSNWRAAELVDSLRCKNIHLILGNHDHAKLDFWKASNLFKSILHYDEIKFHGQKIILCHYPIAEWNSGHHSAWHLHGHTHGGFDYAKANLADKRIMDVGVDAAVSPMHFSRGHLPYAPFEFEYIRDFFAATNRGSIEHHGKAD